MYEVGAKPSIPAPTRRSGVVAYLRRHPVFCLLLLSPGIPEYLSGSSSFAILTLNPILFFLFVGLNVGLYGPGVILIREAMIRWKKGWATVFLLGFAYAIVEEGLDLSTFFNSKAGPVGILGVYGHWLGVNWVWTVGLMLFHSSISIALPILLHRFAFPALKAQSFLAGKKLYSCLTILFFDSIALFTIVNYWAGPEIIIGSAISVLAFIYAAKKVPANLLTADLTRQPRSTRKLALLGAVFFPSTFLIGGVSAGVNIPPMIPMILEVLFTYLIIRTAFRSLGPSDNLAGRVSLAIGLVVPIMVFGLIASITTAPLILIADISFGLFLRRTWKNNSRQHLVSLARSLSPLTPNTPLTSEQNRPA